MNKMKSKFSTNWESSKKPSKQRKFLRRMPLHLNKKKVTARLSKDLASKYSRRTLPIRVGDEVKVLKGEFKGSKGIVEEVIRKTGRVYVKGISLTKRDGSKARRPIHASNTIIISAKEDRRRFKDGGKEKEKQAGKKDKVAENKAGSKTENKEKKEKQ